MGMRVRVPPEVSSGPSAQPHPACSRTTGRWVAGRAVPAPLRGPSAPRGRFRSAGASWLVAQFPAPLCGALLRQVELFRYGVGAPGGGGGGWVTQGRLGGGGCQIGARGTARQATHRPVAGEQPVGAAPVPEGARETTHSPVVRREAGGGWGSGPG